jgi:hypothetical protein
METHNLKSKLLVLTDEQQTAYNRFIHTRNKCKVVITQTNVMAKHIPQSAVVCSVDIAGMNHPVFQHNDDYESYCEAFQAWLRVEPQFREKERMRSSRGDYAGLSDNWGDDDLDVDLMEDLVELVKKVER